MALTPSNMLPLGTPLPAFQLLNTEGKRIASGDFVAAPALLVMFICNHCPYVKHLRQALAQFSADFQKKGVSIVAINSNDVEKYPDDSPPKMALEKQSAGYTFDYLFDETQSVAKAFQAACTPDFFVFDGHQKLAYRGQFDASRPGNSIHPTGSDLAAALDAILAGKAPGAHQKPSIGCNIKWKS